MVMAPITGRFLTPSPNKETRKPQPMNKVHSAPSGSVGAEPVRSASLDEGLDKAKRGILKDKDMPLPQGARRSRSRGSLQEGFRAGLRALSRSGSIDTSSLKGPSRSGSSIDTSVGSCSKDSGVLSSTRSEARRVTFGGVDFDQQATPEEKQEFMAKGVEDDARERGGKARAKTIDTGDLFLLTLMGGFGSDFGSDAESTAVGDPLGSRGSSVVEDSDMEGCLIAEEAPVRQPSISSPSHSDRSSSGTPPWRNNTQSWI